MFKKGGTQITRLDELRGELQGYVEKLNTVKDYSRILHEMLIYKVEEIDDINKYMLEMNVVNMDPYNESGHNMNIDNILNMDNMARYLDKLKIFNDIYLLDKEIYKNAHEVNRLRREIKENTDNIRAELGEPNNNVVNEPTRTGGSSSIKRTRRIKSRNRKSLKR